MVAGIGSVLLLPELLSKPRRDGATGELAELGALLGLAAADPWTAAGNGRHPSWQTTFRWLGRQPGHALLDRSP
jgi:hypothetical protein